MVTILEVPKHRGAERIGWPRYPVRAAMLTLLLVACGSESAPIGTTPFAEGASTLSAEAYCRVATMPGLRAWHRDVVTVCGDGTPSDLPPGCSVSIVQPDGRLVDTAIEDAVLARRLAGERILIRTGAGEIVVYGPAVDQRLPLATYGVGPGVSADGTMVAFVTEGEATTLPIDGVLDPEAGLRVVMWSVGDTALLRTVHHDDSAMAAWPFAGGEEVAFVSTRSGVASLWRVNVERELAFQITNQGTTDVEQDFVPAPTEGALWVGDGPTLVYDATLDADPSIWHADLDSGEVVELGPGEWPFPRDDRFIHARKPSGSGPACAGSYPVTAPAG